MRGDEIRYVGDVNADAERAARLNLDVQGVVQISRRRRVNTKHQLVSKVPAFHELIIRNFPKFIRFHVW